MRRSVLLLSVTALVIGVFAPAAHADPKTDPLYIECVGVPSGWITSNGNGTWTPGLGSDSTGVYIPYEFSFAEYFTPEGGEEILLGEFGVAKKPPRNAQSHPHGVCTFGDSFDVVDHPELGTGTARFVGTASVFYTGR